MKVGDLVILKRHAEQSPTTKLTPWALRAQEQGTAMLVIPNPTHWNDAPMSGDARCCCVLFENKLRVLSCSSVEVVSHND